MCGMMFGGQILPAANVIRPVRHPRSSEVESSWNLPLERIPRWINVRRPDHRAISLRAEVCVAGKYQSTILHVAAEAIVNCAGVHEWINVEVSRSWAD